MVAAGDATPERFVAATSRLSALLTPKTVRAHSRTSPCLRARSGDLIAPSQGYAPTPAVLEVLDDTVIVDGAPRVLARLGCPTIPRVADIRARLTQLAAQPGAPPAPAALYVALSDAAQRERFALRTLGNDVVIWTGPRWAAPVRLSHRLALAHRLLCYGGGTRPHRPTVRSVHAARGARKPEPA